MANARRLQGIILGKTQAIGFASENMTQVINEIWVREAVATAAIEGEKLKLDMVCSSMMRQPDFADTKPSSRNVDGLVQRGALISRGAGSETKYFVNVPGWLHEA